MSETSPAFSAASSAARPADQLRISKRPSASGIFHVARAPRPRANGLSREFVERGAHATSRLRDPALAELGHHRFSHLLHFVARLRPAVARRASARWRIHHAEIAHDALKHVLQLPPVDLLL